MPSAPPPPPPGTIRFRVFSLFTRLTAAAFRVTKGRVGGKFLGAPVLILHHVGRKTGTARTTPLIYGHDGQDLIVVASRGGSDFTPAWWVNLKANPETTVDLSGGETRRVRAEEVPVGADRDQLWAQAVKRFPDYEVARTRTARQIPVIRLRTIA